MSFVSSKGNILCRLINIELYKIFAIINRVIKGSPLYSHNTVARPKNNIAMSSPGSKLKSGHNIRRTILFSVLNNASGMTLSA